MLDELIENLGAIRNKVGRNLPCEIVIGKRRPVCLDDVDVLMGYTRQDPDGVPLAILFYPTNETNDEEG